MVQVQLGVTSLCFSSGMPKQATCEGSLAPRAPCHLSRTQANGPKQIRGPCRLCDERRCRAHCKCARENTLTGHQGSRDRPAAKAIAKAKAKAKAIAAAPVARPAPPAAPAANSEGFSLRPVGRPPATSVEVLTTIAWMSRLLTDVETARGILVASYTYDHPNLTAPLVRRLDSRCRCHD